MENYSNYTSEDFLQDERFRKWIFSDGQEDHVFWEDFQTRFPEKSNELALAKNLLLSLHQFQEKAESGVKEKIWKQVSDANEAFETEYNPQTRSLYRWWMSAAAAILLIVGGLAWNLQSTVHNKISEISGSELELSTDLTINFNNTNSIRTVELKDGSTVLLKPGSTLKYTAFSGNKRTVFLEGEGFFDVTKDPSKPFMVYAGNIVVKVVGTSFNVISGSDIQASNVTVSSGKVQVFEAIKGTNTPHIENKNSVFLTPNQQVVFDIQTKIFKKGLVEQPIELIKPEHGNKFNFENTSVNVILTSLENAYGVDIQFDQDVFANCKITAPLNNLTLFRRLDLICQTIGATYEVFGTEIIITGGNCNL